MAEAVPSSAETPPAEPTGGSLTATASGRELDLHIWAMAWPAILSFVVVNLVDIVDVRLVGPLGRQTVAAWGYATQCVNLVETLLRPVGIGTVALVASALGARDAPRARQALAGSLLVALVIAGLGLVLVLAGAERDPAVSSTRNPTSSRSPSPTSG